MDGVTRVGGASYWTRNRAIKEAVVTAGRTINAIYGMDATRDDGGDPGLAPVRCLQWVRAAAPDHPV